MSSLDFENQLFYISLMKVWFSSPGEPMARITEKIDTETKYMK